MVLLFDMDGVVADLHTPWLEAIRTHLGETYRPEAITDYSMLGKREYLDLLPGVYADVKPYPGAQEAIARFLKAGFRVKFVTSSGRDTLLPKWDWVVRWFPNVASQGLRESWQTGYAIGGLHFCWDKQDLARPGYVLFDDNPGNVVAFRDAGGVAVVYDQPYNRAVPGERVLDWPDLERWVMCRAEVEG